MSEAHETGGSANGAMDIEARAAEYLQRRRYWNWSEADQAELQAWLAEALAHRVAFWRLEATLGRTERLAALRPTAYEDVTQSPPRKFSPLRTVAAATAFLIALTGAGALLFLSMPDERTYATPIGGHKTVMLADGTHVEMNTDTVLRASQRAGERKIWLDKGEAYFQVKHDSARPFMVLVGDRRVTDLGTKFLVRRDVERLEVAVVEGRVRFDAAGGPAESKSALLAAGEDVVATPNTVFVTKKPAHQMTEELGWRQGMLMFDHTTLADAAAEFNRYNNRKLVIADSTVANVTIDGMFPTNDVEAFTDVVRHILRLHVESYEDEIAISR